MRLIAVIFICLVISACSSPGNREQVVDTLAPASDTIFVVQDHGEESSESVFSKSEYHGNKGYEQVSRTGLLFFGLPLKAAQQSGGRGGADANWNYAFYNLNTDSSFLLTREKMLIRLITILQKADKDTGLLLFAVRTKDTNGDGHLGSGDAEQLYTTDLYGKSFEAVSPIGQHFYRHEFHEKENKLLFSTITDSDGDKDFDPSDGLIWYQKPITAKGMANPFFGKQIIDELRQLNQQHWPEKHH